MDRKSSDVETIIHRARTRVSRAQMLQALLAGGTLAVIPGAAAAARNSGTGRFEAPYYPQTGGTYSPELHVEIVSNVLTLKYFVAASAVATLSNPAAVAALGFTGLRLKIAQAIGAQVQDQIDFLLSLVPDAAPVTTTFTIAASVFATKAAYAVSADIGGRIVVAADITAAREFAELGQPTIAKNMVQMATADAEALATLRTLSAIDGLPGFDLPNNKAFETDLFLYTRDAVALFRTLGLIGGTGTPIAYPGRDAVLAAVGSAASAVIQRAPNNAGSSVTYTGPASITGERP